MNDTFCCLPWIHLATHPNGVVSLCCQSDMREGLSMAKNNDGKGLLNLNSHSINTIANSDYFKEVRLEMLEGKMPKGCLTCYQNESKGILSKRMYENEQLKYTIDDAKKITSKNGEIDVNYEFIELRLGNVCNLKCVTCNPVSSSKWKSDYQRLYESRDIDFLTDYSWVTKDLYKWTEADDFWEDLFNNSKNLKAVYLNGGEPTLIKKHWHFLDQLIESGRAENISLIYSLNLTTVPDEALTRWSKFKKVTIQASLDDLRDRNKYIRYPANWDKSVDNLNKLSNSGLELQLMQTVSVLNFFYLDEYYEWVRDHMNNASIVYNFVKDPEFFSVNVLPIHMRREILDDYSEKLPGHLYHHAKAMFDNSEYNPKGFNNLKVYLKHIDQLRNNDVKEVFPRFENMLNKYNLTLG